jgi:hypothetical protein
LVTSVCGIDAKGPTATRDAYVDRCATGEIPADVPTEVAAILARHAPAAARLNDFSARLRAASCPADIRRATRREGHIPDSLG